MADLSFTGPRPGVDVLAKFLALIKGVCGVVAVHCGEGLLQTGILIAFYLMKHHGFTVRAATAWLHILQPWLDIVEWEFISCSEVLMRWEGNKFRSRCETPKWKPKSNDPTDIAHLVKEVNTKLNCCFAKAFLKVAQTMQVAEEKLRTVVGIPVDYISTA